MSVYFMCGQRNIRDDLIKPKLEKFLPLPKWKTIGCPSNRFIDWLFRHYYTVEFCELWYDSEPEIDDESLSYSEQYRIWRDNEEHRMTFNNWVDPLREGIWGLSQQAVDKASRFALKSLRSTPVKKKDRLFVSLDSNHYYIYWYGRDLEGLDMAWIMNKRPTKCKRKTRT